MSGGHFNYAQFRFREVAEELDELIAPSSDSYYYGAYSLETLQQFEIAKKFIETSAIYLQRIDWLVSGDDGEDTFHERLRDELNNQMHAWIAKDGRPTQEALRTIETWSAEKPVKELFAFIKKLWHRADTAWVETSSDGVTTYTLSTGDWNSNESIIEAMKRNNLFWQLHWHQSTRGGHYVFTAREQ